MEQSLELTLGLLERTPGALDAMLRGLPEAWTHADEGAGTWKVFEVVGHLAKSEVVDWMPRVKKIMSEGGGRAFDRLNRDAYKEFVEGRSVGQLLDDFARFRAENVATLRGMNLGERELAREGVHPAFGLVTLSQLLATWAVHDMTHVHQISRTLANQYREAVGPWSVYLGVLRCEGHSDKG
jgi:hypothetical protein